MMYICNGIQTGSFGMPSEEKSHGSISFKTYVRYFHLGAGYAVILLVLGVMVAGEVSEWLKIWRHCDFIVLIRQVELYQTGG